MADLPPPARDRRAGAVCCGLLLAVGLGFLAPIWAGKGIVCSDKSDIVFEHVGVKTIFRKSVLEEGRFPLWNPSMNSGAPAFANPQSMYVFPFDLLYLFLPVHRATNLVVALNLLAGGLGMLLFCWRRVRHPATALFCATAYMLSHRALAMVHSGWLPKMSMLALAPLLLWAVGEAVGKGGGRRSALLALVVALGLAQGDMQQLYYSALAAGTYAAVLAWKGRASGASGRLGWLALGAVAGVLLACPVLLPRIELAALSTRAEPSYSFFLYRPPGLGRLLTLLDPLDSAGAQPEYWEYNFYFGLVSLPLAALALVRASRPLAVAGVLVPVLLCFDTPLLRLSFDYLPGFSLFRIPGRMLLVAQLFTVLLAGRGLDELASLFRKPVLVASVAIAGALLDSAVRMLPRLGTSPMAEAFPEHALHAELRRERTMGRVAAIGRTSVPYGMAAHYGVDLVNGYASLNLKHYVDFLSVLKYGDAARAPRGPKVWTDLESLARPELLSLLNVTHVVANAPVPVEDLGYQEVAVHPSVVVPSFYEGNRTVPVHVWRQRRPIGGAIVATSVRAVATEEESLRALASPRALEEVAVLGPAPEPIDARGGKARLVRNGVNVYEYEVEGDGRMFVVLSQIWYPGWRALVDGAEVPVHRAHHALVGCVVPPGRHRVVLSMSFPMLWWALGAMGLGGALCAVLLFRGPPLLGRKLVSGRR
ncbi:MAG: hypothetical protein HYZ28_25890 [Myxococcales bacterium]|nr:hypothetical protein [Myxococcales bacterium]